MNFLYLYNMLNVIRIVVFFTVFGLSLPAGAQPVGTLYADAGESNVSEGFCLNTAVLGGYQYDAYTLIAGAGIDLISPADNLFTNIMVKPGRKFVTGNFPFELSGLFTLNRSYKTINEMNLGVLVNVERTHFTWKLGTGFRTYYLTQYSRETYDAGLENNLHENWNVMYCINYMIKPRGNAWNVSLALTNQDYFLINQESNPMFRVRGYYDVSTALKVFSEAWYKSAGAFNISVNYFGFFIRTGLTWQPNIGT